jgi:hypothetical protein
MPEDWAADAASKFDKQEEAERTKREGAIQKRKALEEQGITLWGEVKRALQLLLKRFNDDERKQVLSAALTKPETITVFAAMESGQREMMASFNSDYSVGYNAKSTRSDMPDRFGHFTMSVADDNKLILVAEQGVEVSVEKAAEHMLDALLERT